MTKIVVEYRKTYKLLLVLLYHKHTVNISKHTSLCMWGTMTSDHGAPHAV